LLDVDFRSIPLFAPLSDSEVQKLDGLAHHQVYEPGDAVFHKGDMGIGVFIVTSGSFELRHDAAPGDGQVEAKLGPGEVFGLTSLLDDEPRRASAYATTPATCAVLTRMTLRLAMAENPGLAIEVIRSMAKSLRDVSALVEDEAPR